MKRNEIVKKDKEWHKLVIERDNYICYNCKKDFSADCYFQNNVNQYLCGDHIKTKGARTDLRHDINNGRAVCFNCHLIRHS